MEFLLPFFHYYAYPFTAEYYIGTANLRGVSAAINAVREFVKAQSRRYHIILQPQVPSFSILSSYSYHIDIMDLLWKGLKVNIEQNISGSTGENLHIRSHRQKYNRNTSRKYTSSLYRAFWMFSSSCNLSRLNLPIYNTVVDISH